MTGIRGILYYTFDRLSEIHHSPFKLDCWRNTPQLFAENAIDKLFPCPATLPFDIIRIGLHTNIVCNHLKRRS